MRVKTRKPRVYRYYICDIDREVNEGRMIPLPVAIRRIQKHIIENIDPDFSEKEFRVWLNSSTEKPFKSNKNRFYWEREV